MKGTLSTVTLNESTAEFIGAFIGDGCIGKYGSGYFFQMTGHAILDRDHYARFLIPVLLRLFPNVHHRLSAKGNVLRLTVYSKALVQFLQGFGFPLGKKATTVRIPDVLLQSKPLTAAVLRGLFDTDGSVFFDKRPVYAALYPRIDLHLQNPGLVRQVFETLIRLGVPATMTKAQTKVQINGAAVQQFLAIVGFSNKRHLHKIQKKPLKGLRETRSATASVA